MITLTTTAAGGRPRIVAQRLDAQLTPVTFRSGYARFQTVLTSGGNRTTLFDVQENFGQVLTGGGLVEVVSAPPAISGTVGGITRHDVRTMHFSNVGAAPVTVQVLTENTGATVVVIEATLVIPANGTARFENGGRWTVYDSTNTVVSEGGSGGGTAPTVTVDPGLQGGRLSLSPTDPIGEVAAATAIHFHAFDGNQIALWSGTEWVQREIPATPLSVAAPLGANAVFDVFAFDNGGTVALELSAAWSAIVGPRAETVSRLSGAWVKDSDNTRRLLGTFYVATTSLSDTGRLRHLDNVDNKIQRVARSNVPGSWSYATPAYRDVNNSVEAVHEWVRCLPGYPLSARHTVTSVNLTPGAVSILAIGVDGGGAPVPAFEVVVEDDSQTVTGHSPSLEQDVGIGLHQVRALEYATAAIAFTFSAYTTKGDA